MAHRDSTSGSAPARSFDVQGELTLAWFGSGDDNYHARINGERIETIVARMLGFPSDAEFQAALNNEVSPDPDQPGIVRTVPRISLSVFVDDDPVV
jgi:hypothetical protein